MKQHTAALIAMVCLATPVFAQSGMDKMALDKQIIANERAINEAVAKNDLKKFHTLVDTHGLGVDPTGFQTIGDYDKMIAAQKIESWNIENPRVEWLSPDVAVVAYKWTGKGAYIG